MAVDYLGYEHEINQVIRRVNVVRGTMALRMECLPAFNYEREQHEVRKNESGAMFVAPDIAVQLFTTIPLTQEGCGVMCEFTLHEGQTT